MLTSGKSIINHNVLQSQVHFIARCCRFHRVDMLIFFLRLSTMFAPSSIFVNKPCIFSKSQARKRERKREYIAYDKTYRKHRAKHRKVSFRVLYVLEQIHERNARVHTKSAESRAESKSAHNVKFAYHYGRNAVGNRAHYNRKQRRKIFVRRKEGYQVFFTDFVYDYAEYQIHNENVCEYFKRVKKGMYQESVDFVFLFGFFRLVRFLRVLFLLL